MKQERRKAIWDCSETSIRLFFSRQGFSAEAVTYRVSKLWKERFNWIYQESDLVGAILDFLKKTPDLKAKFLDYLSVPGSEPEEPAIESGESETIVDDRSDCRSNVSTC